ncbi:uncharacterized protein BYT42DRAFT_126091 [Radiomyces spectabilis]|uniref:uncharacterized protein n=1 Tax=Radiomyces spectabilis TaxID=64574 RepID=UPI00221FB82F|nr:uncharacterized protein BYT42DRAFT_126091 [Radiomyces spectabilis]KAI8368308.1 hypothetical protein BYT42DRAFT_126091 [Radiomyces spectabilis]
MLKMILSQYELEHSQHNQQEAGQDEHAALPRLFSLFPLSTFKWRYITINPNVLAAFLGRSISGRFEENMNMFYCVFNFQRLKLDSFEQLQDPDRRRKLAFANLIRTDGFGVDVMLFKSSLVSQNEFCFYSDLVSDVRYISREVQGAALTNISLCGLDPGRTHVFTASGSVRHAKEERRRMDRAQVTDLFLNIPTAKTVST